MINADIYNIIISKVSLNYTLKLFYPLAFSKSLPLFSD